MTPKSPTTRASQLALLVALLFGIVAMHSLGHPREHGASAERATAGGHAGAVAGGGHARAGGGGEHARGVSGGRHARGAMAVNPVDVTPMTANSADVHPMTAGSMDVSPAAGSPAAGSPAAGGPADGHDSGMDPLSVCLAVLGAALTLALLYAAVRHRPRGTPVHVPGPARLLDALRPHPPPPRALLTRLAVLRV